MCIQTRSRRLTVKCANRKSILSWACLSAVLLSMLGVCCTLEFVLLFIDPFGRPFGEFDAVGLCVIGLVPCVQALGAEAFLLHKPII